MSFFEQKQEVQKWLETVMDCERASQFDFNDERLISELYNLKQSINEAERDAKVLTDFKKLQIVDYQNEIDRMSVLTQGIGINTGSMCSLEDEPLEKVISILAEVASLLGVDNPSEDDLDLALADLRLKASDTHVFELLRQQKVERDKEETLESIKSLSQTESALKNQDKEAKIQVDIMNNLRKKTAFMMEKLKQYSQSVDTYKFTVKKNGLRKDILHETLLQLKKDLDEMEEKELKPKQIKLRGYNGLPPSLELAKAKVAEAESELESVMQELTKEISDVHV